MINAVRTYFYYRAKRRLAYRCAEACSTYVAFLLTQLLHMKPEDEVPDATAFKVAFWTRNGIRYARLAADQHPFRSTRNVHLRAGDV